MHRMNDQCIEYKSKRTSNTNLDKLAMHFIENAEKDLLTGKQHEQDSTNRTHSIQEVLKCLCREVHKNIAVNNNLCVFIIFMKNAFLNVFIF